jgi:hypothetical protein
MVDVGSQQEDMEQINFPMEVKICLQKPTKQESKEEKKGRAIPKLLEVGQTYA